MQMLHRKPADEPVMTVEDEAIDYETQCLILTKISDEGVMQWGKRHYAFSFRLSTGPLRCVISRETNSPEAIVSHKMPQRKTTVTSTFGSPGSEGHDS